jgi:ATP-dependent helicase/nuclease subunit A
MDQADFDSKQDSVQKDAESDGYAGVVDISERLGYQYPHAALSGIKSKYSASELSERSSAAEYYCTARPAFMSKGELTPAQRGTATHEFMQFADYSAAKSDLDAEIERLCNEGFLMPVQADAIDRESVRGFFASNLFERIERADRVLREARFITEVPVCDIDSSVSEKNEFAVVQGVADCVFFENGGIVILDFKTDRIKSPYELVSRYYIQLKIYADALGRTYERPVRQCLIYSLFLNREIDLNIQT